MPTLNTVILLIAAMLLVTATGCEPSENQKLAEMAERHLDRQSEQNRQMNELQREVAQGSRQLVAADAKAREEMLTLQREVQAERAEVGRQRDALETERRDLAAKRRIDPILAAAITNLGLLLACLLPLVLCWYLLQRPTEAVEDHAMMEVLLDDIIADQPRFLPRTELPALGLQEPDGSQPRPNDSDAGTDSA